MDTFHATLWPSTSCVARPRDPSRAAGRRLRGVVAAARVSQCAADAAVVAGRLSSGNFVFSMKWLLFVCTQSSVVHATGIPEIASPRAFAYLCA